MLVGVVEFKSAGSRRIVHRRVASLLFVESMFKFETCQPDSGQGGKTSGMFIRVSREHLALELFGGIF